MQPFGTKDWKLSIPMIFLWNGFLHRDFGGFLARDLTLCKISFESISLF
jgi:hypothetical protein